MAKKDRFGKSFLFLFTAMLLFLGMALRIPAHTTGQTDGSWLQELLAERQQKDIEFKTSPTSPIAGSLRLTVSAPEKTFITIKDGSVTIQPRGGAGVVFSVFGKQGKWYWDDAAPGTVSCSQGGRAVISGVDALTPGSLFKVDRFTLAVYPGPDTVALIVFDPQRKQQLSFEHLLYFPADPAYAVKARLEKFPEKREIKIITTRKLEKTFYRYGRVHFQLQGRDLELTALKSSLEGPDSSTLFIPFKDDTNGKESYEVGRFLDVPEPAGEEFILDFNRCYNPLCNYSPAYNCPLPPLENILDIAVPAGEKAYPH